MKQRLDSDATDTKVYQYDTLFSINYVPCDTLNEL